MRSVVTKNYTSMISAIGFFNRYRPSGLSEPVDIDDADTAAHKITLKIS